MGPQGSYDSCMSPAKVQPQQAKASVDESSESTATLAEIARAAGVSAPTVSKVLNGRADVAPSTRTKVEELLLRHGYRRRRGASQQSQLIDLVFHELDSAWAMEVVRGVENVAREEGLSLVLSESATASPRARRGWTAFWPAARPG